jgi:hypothetical protein
MVNDPVHVVFNSQGELFVSNRHGNVGGGVGSIARFTFDAAGNFFAHGSITGNSLEAVHGLAFSPAGELFAANYFNKMISRFLFDLQGNPIPNGTIATGEANQGLVFASNGELFTTHGSSIVKRWVFDPVTGAAIPNGVFTVPGSSRLHGLTFSPRGELFISDPDTNLVSRFLFLGTGNPVSNGSITVPAGPLGVAFSSAGELFVTSHFVGGISRFLFDGGGKAIPNGFIPTPSLGGVAILNGVKPRDDFNSDGQPDLVWQNQVTGQIGVWFMNGIISTGVSLFNPSQVVDTNLKIVGRADFNNDGKADLVWQNQSTGHIVVWFMDGVNLISPSFFNPGQVADISWKIVGTDDFNTDGKPDLVWQNQATGHIAVWFMDGVNLISPSYFTPPQVADINWKIVGTNDFNTDGKADLVWQNQSTGHIVVWYMDGINLISPSFFNPGQLADISWRIVGTDDFNNDGKPDLVWQNQPTGHIVVWFMDGVNLISPNYFTPPQVGDITWKMPNVWALIK